MVDISIVDGVINRLISGGYHIVGILHVENPHSGGAQKIWRSSADSAPRISTAIDVAYNMSGSRHCWWIIGLSPIFGVEEVEALAKNKGTVI